MNRLNSVICLFTLTVLLCNVYTLFSDNWGKIYSGNHSVVLTNERENTHQQNNVIKKGIIVVKLKKSLNKSAANIISSYQSLNVKMNVWGIQKVDQPYFYLSQSQLVGAEDLTRIFHLYFSEEQDPQKVADEFAFDPNVLYAEPLYVHSVEEIPNDPAWAQNQHGDLAHIQAPEAWNLVKGEAGEVVIGIVDNGTEWNHPDLVDNIWQNLGEDADNDGRTIEFIENQWVFDPGDTNKIDDDGNGYIDDVIGWNFLSGSNDPTGSADHGTPVAGAAGAVTNNNTGGASISWNCKIMPVAALGEGTDTYQGIIYAVHEGAEIINCSWGRVGGFSSYEQDIIDFAYNNDVLVVASAGNGGDDNIGDNNDVTPHYPSNFNHVLCVGSTNKTDDVKATFSNYGAASVDVFAPGVRIYVPYPGGRYALVDGTSLSTPIVAGLAGLLKTQIPDMPPAELIRRIKLTSENIDSVNSEFAGLLGHGRVNAFKAVDPNFPVIKVAGVNIYDSNGNGIVNPGENIEIGVELTSYYTNITSASVKLIEDDEFIITLDDTAEISQLNVNDTSEVMFECEVFNEVFGEHEIEFKIDITVDDYYVQDYFNVKIFGDFLTHTTGNISVSITAEGNIGHTGFGRGLSAGDGFIFNNKDYLYEGGIMVGTGLATISDCIRGVDPNVQEHDFRIANDETLTIVSPGIKTYEKGSVRLVDSLTIVPIGISILQESYADTVSSVNNIIILKYTITNLKAVTISNLHCGLFMDWDINSGGRDFSDYDSLHTMGIVKNLPVGGNRWLATKLLTNKQNVSYRTIDNGSEIDDGFSMIEKWDFLTGGIQTTEVSVKNVSTLITEGPFTINPGEDITVSFALIAAQSQAELETSASQAQQMWDNVISDINTKEESPLIQAFYLTQNYPNPFNPSTTIEFNITQNDHVELIVYNLMGQKIKTLVDEKRNGGKYQVTWDGNNNDGIKVASGVYICRLKVGDFKAFRKMILIK